jgi:hypothetical protein
MNKVVVREIAAADLPLGLRGDIDPSHLVEVTVRDLSMTEPTVRGSGHFSRFFQVRRANYGDVDAVLAHVRAVRDGEG